MMLKGPGAEMVCGSNQKRRYDVFDLLLPGSNKNRRDDAFDVLSPPIRYLLSPASIQSSCDACGRCLLCLCTFLCPPSPPFLNFTNLLLTDLFRNSTTAFPFAGQPAHIDTYWGQF